jgi:hypothetical protein
MDPGIRGGAVGAGSPLPGLTADETAFFRDGLARFADIEVVTGGTNNGLGPRLNSNQCLSCHSQPAAGGSSPARNPLIAIATLNGAKNIVPWFIVPNGPIREVRFKRNPDGTNDGGVHNLFVITGRTDAAGCNITQPNFQPAGDPLSGQGGNPNVIFPFGQKTRKHWIAKSSIMDAHREGQQVGAVAGVCDGPGQPRVVAAE